MAFVPSTESDSAAYGIGPRLLLASLALASGVVHLAMAPIHAPESTTDAILFAAAGWAQILLGVGLVLRPSRPLLMGAILLNLAIIVAYVFSRTTGLPWGGHPGEAEDAQGIDLMITSFEALLVLGAALLLAFPRFATSRHDDRGFTIESVAVAAAIPLVVLFATSVALADPELTQHGHGGGSTFVSSSGGHAHGGSSVTDDQLVSLASNRCDLGFNTAAYWNETTIAGIDTIMGGDAPPAPSGPVQGSPELDKLVARQLTTEGEVGDAIMVLELAKVSDEVYEDWLRWLGSVGNAHEHGTNNPGAPDDNHGMGGHIGPQPWIAMTDQAECDKLAEELELARATALKYPTVADAKAAGWRQVTGYVPGIAAHFMNFSIVDGIFNIEEPEMILYDGTGDDARVIGLSYYVIHEGAAEPTQGFTGPNDHYHRHDGLCVNASGVIGDSTTTEEECTARGGQKRNGSNGWMNHVWVVPGCESPWGLFSGASPVLDGQLTKNSGSDGGGCAGSGVRDRFDFTPGEVENTPTQVGGELEVALGN
jgi:hypothetical protein